MRCAVEVAPVRAEPRDDAEQVTQALRGEPLERRGAPGRLGTGRHRVRLPRLDACGSGRRRRGRAARPTASDPLAAARAYLGAPYEWGGLTAAGIDCSGLVHIAYRATGRLVPRDSWQQEAAGEAVAAGEERPGDLVAYGAAERADHIAFWLGDGRILHATAKEARGVVEEPESDELPCAAAASFGSEHG